MSDHVEGFDPIVRKLVDTTSIAPVRVKGVNGAGKVFQRDYLRNLVQKFGMNESKQIMEYAEVEKRGEISRARNRTGLTPQGYALALVRDAKVKG